MDGESPFVQSTYVRDVVFPLFLASESPGGIKADSFLGTGFLIGTRGMAMTAGHVAKNLHAGSAVAGFVAQSGEWYGYSVLEVELHPIEDIAIVHLDSPPGQVWKSWLLPCARWEGSSRSYGLWGYPDDIYHEIVVDGIAKGRPDLIFSQGHVRRRMSSIPLPSVQGRGFFELSAIAGRGCSGSPVIVWPPNVNSYWEVIGVYCGERISQSTPISVAYAARIDAVADWIPKILDGPVTEEKAFIPPWT